MDRSNFSVETNHLIDLLFSPEWPEAVPDFMICGNNEKDKRERAEGVLNYISCDLENKKFLDFGCGEGHVVDEVSKSASFSIGYDINPLGLLWECKEKNYILSSDFNLVKQNSPYNIILLYDVLDHVEFPEKVLSDISSLCSEETKVIVRCHPWMSRHGGHLYEKINKAWMQLVFTEEELKNMGYNMPFMQKIYHPLGVYNSWFDNSNFRIIKSSIIKSGVESFFRRSKIMSRLPIDKFRGNFPDFQMSQCFDDYILSLKK